MSEVRIGPAADALARAGAPVARAEGFERHAASMEVRENPGP
jgi:histidinol dehydrogenase